MDLDQGVGGGMELVGYTMAVCMWWYIQENSDLQLVHGVLSATYGGVSATTVLTFWHFF